MPRFRLGSAREPLLLALGAGLVGLAVVLWAVLTSPEPLPSFHDQACALPHQWLARIQRGHLDGRSGEISLLPKKPAYMASGAGGWSHSGPWEYLQRVPLVFYGPGLIKPQEIDRPVTLANVAPTMGALLHSTFDADGGPLAEVASINSRTLLQKPPKLILTVVWDGGGWNGLDQWPDAWPNLRRLMNEGVSYTDATVGSSPSVTPSTHTTLGTGVFPDRHGITGIPVRGDDGTVEDSFQRGESSAYLRVPAFAERWDEQTNNKALVGMIGYEPWHLGMIGQGAERGGGDKDDAAWLNIETNEWITNPDHYTLPDALVETGGLQQDLDALDAADGKVDDSWRTQDILTDRDRIEETPAFVHYHGRGLRNLIAKEGYGRDKVTDLLFTNFKQIDRDAHYYSMEAPEVRDAMVASDEELGRIADFLDRRVGKGNYVIVVTADHGMQPDAPYVDGYGINPTALEEDIKAEFGPVLRGIWPTEAYVFPDNVKQEGVTVEELARFIGDYRLQDNVAEGDETGQFGPSDRVFAMAVPSAILKDLDCGP